MANRVRASRSKYHYIYKTICIVTGRFYVGLHSTNKLDDGYIGSGKRLWNSIDEYGKENHQCEILEWLPDRESVIQREKEIITEEFLSDPMCMNIAKGGGVWPPSCAGFIDEAHQIRCSSAGGKIGGKHPNSGFRRRDTQLKVIATKTKNNSWATRGTTGFKYSEASKKQMSEAQQGKSNSQFGTCWICNGSEVKKIHKEELDAFLERGWRRGRK